MPSGGFVIAVRNNFEMTVIAFFRAYLVTILKTLDGSFAERSHFFSLPKNMHHMTIHTLVEPSNQIKTYFR